MDGAALPVPQRGTYTGLVLYWEVDLCDGNRGPTLYYYFNDPLNGALHG
jgi:hypothetical protein